MVHINTVTYIILTQTMSVVGLNKYGIQVKRVDVVYVYVRIGRPSWESVSPHDVQRCESPPPAMSLCTSQYHARQWATLIPSGRGLFPSPLSPQVPWTHVQGAVGEEGKLDFGLVMLARAICVPQ